MSALRAELAAIDPPRPCDRAAERAGLGPAATGAAPDAAVARLAVRLERDAGPGAAFVWETAADHCRVAWLRGLFLHRGSLSLAGGRTHLEFVVEAGEAPRLAVRLAELGLPAGWRVRRAAGVVTWKSAASVLRFLRLTGGSAAVLELEARLVARSLQASLNRVANAEGANLLRAVRASSRQLAAIEALDGTGRLEGLDPVVVAVARARQEMPEASLADLAATVEVSRAAVQRSLARLEAEAGLDDGSGRPAMP